jgi:hypothetical protein
LSANQSRDALQRAIHDFVMLSTFRDTEAAQAAITQATVFLRSALDTNDIARRPISRDPT